MREVLISIQPRWVEKIVSGEKTVEVRKTRPKCETPFKCYIYCTQGKFKDLGVIGETIYRKRMKVIGEFVCDKIEGYTNYSICLQIGSAERRKELLENSCLTLEEWQEYIGYDLEQFGYAWHISDLVIYDEPRELSDFKHECNGICIDTKKQIKCDRFQDEIQSQEFSCDRLKPITRAPQSWQFCVATEPRQTAD